MRKRRGRRHGKRRKREAVKRLPKEDKSLQLRRCLPHDERLGIRKTVGGTFENSEALGKFVRFSLQETMGVGAAIQCALTVENDSMNNEGGFSTRR